MGGVEASENFSPKSGEDDNPGFVQNQVVLVSEVIPGIPVRQYGVGAAGLGLGEAAGDMLDQLLVLQV